MKCCFMKLFLHIIYILQRRCFCDEEFTCLSYNTTSTQEVHQNVIFCFYAVLLFEILKEYIIQRFFWTFFVFCRYVEVCF